MAQSSGVNSGITMLMSVVLAVFIGFCFPNIGESFKPFSEVYLTLISISVIPIIFSSVTSSIIKLISEKSDDVTIPRVVFFFVSSLVVAGIIGMICCYIFAPDKSVNQSEYISKMIFENMQKSILEIPVNQPVSGLNKFNFMDFFITLVPKNPFEAFAKGNVIQILTVSILLGSAIAKLGEDNRKLTLNALSVLASSFGGVLNISIKILPIGMFFLLSSGLSAVSMDVLLGMKDFCISAGICFCALIVISLLLMWIYSPIGLFASIRELKETITVAFSTCSNQVTLPFLIKTLSEKFKLQENAVNLAIPLGVTMCRTSNAAYYAFVVVFVSLLYNEPLSLLQESIVVFGAIIASLAASGASGVIAISMLSVILDPLDLPIGSILIVLILVEPIMEPLRTVTSLIMNAAISCAVINKNRRREKCS